MEISFLLHSLNLFPMLNDTNIFEACEKKILSRDKLQSRHLPTVIHGFARRHLGSPELFKLFENTFIANSRMYTKKELI